MGEIAQQDEDDEVDVEGDVEDDEEEAGGRSTSYSNDASEKNETTDPTFFPRR